MRCAITTKAHDSYHSAQAICVRDSLLEVSLYSSPNHCSEQEGRCPTVLCRPVCSKHWLRLQCRLPQGSPSWRQLVVCAYTWLPPDPYHYAFRCADYAVLSRPVSTADSDCYPSVYCVPASWSLVARSRSLCSVVFSEYSLA